MIKMIRATLACILISHFCFGQSLTLKGHLINSNTKEPITGAKIYILGGDSESQTTSSGQYRLNLELGNKKFEYGDRVDIYILHDFYGFHKSSIILSKSEQADIYIEPENMIKVTGTILDATTYEPIPNISVILIDESNLESEKSKLIRKTDEFGAYYFLVSKSVLAGQRYMRFHFKDIDNENYVY